MSENLAESVNVKMVCFRNVAYQDDGLRPYSSSLVPYGFQTLDATDVTGDTYESDGDIGIIHTGTGSSNGYVTYAKYCTHSTIPILNSTLAIVRGKCLTGNAKWSTQIYYNDESGNTMSTWNTNTEFTDFYYTIPTGTLTLFNIKVQTTDGADASAAFDYVLLSSNTPMTLTPSDMDIENVLTEGYDTADFTCSYNDVNIDLNPRVSDHIKIWESKESTVNLKKIFTGFIESTELKANGKEHMWINSNASGYGKYLAERKVKINRSTFANELVLLALNPVISTGKITAYNLPTSTEVITVKTE